MTKLTLNVPREHIEAINRLCLALLKMPPAPAKSLGGRPKGSTKRKSYDGVDPERLMAICVATKSLDPQIDANWTSRGVPRIPAIQQITGFPDVAYWEVQKCFPGYNREKAFLRFNDQKLLHFTKGQWHFWMVRDDRTFRRNLKTADIEIARQKRDHFLLHGNWDYDLEFAQGGTKSTPVRTTNKETWQFSGPKIGWRKD